MSEEARAWEYGPTVAFFFLTGISRILDFRFSILDCRTEELEMSEEAPGWEHRLTVAFFC